MTKIVIRSVGVLKAFDTPNSPALERLTTIYGKNGRGKTTLSAVLRSASLGKHAVVNGRKTFGADGSAIHVALKLSNGKTLFFKDGKWNQPSAPIEVFDTSFIADNLFAGESVSLNHDRGLFSVILGREGVKLARQQEFFVAAAKRTGARLKDCENALVNDVPADQSREEFFAASVPANIDDLVTQAQKDLKAVQQADRLSKLKRLSAVSTPVFDADIGPVLEKTLQDIEASARTRLADHFSRFKLGKQGEAWVKFGLEHIHDESCPFCGKADVDQQGLVTLYNQIFGLTYQAHLDSIRAVAGQVENALGPDAVAAISAARAANADSILSWLEFVAFDSALPKLDEALASLSSAYAIFKRLLDAKREAPLSAISEPEAIAAARTQLECAIASIGDYNDSVAKMEAAIDKRQGETPLTEAQAQARLANLTKRRRRNDLGVQARIDALFKAKRQDERVKHVRTEVQKRLKKANNDAAEHYYGKVNHFLENFEASFRISQFTNSMSGNAGAIDYGLIIRGHQVARGRGDIPDDVASFRNTLSTGDKTTLAFAFFLAGLERLEDLSERIVVFDDPMSSHDSHRRTKTVDMLKNLCARTAQVIVLSHDEHFLRQVSRRCNGSKQASYKIIPDGADNWSKIEPADLDELCRSNHALQIDKLKAFYDRHEGDPADIISIVRRVLETHYRGAYPAYFKPADNLGPIIVAIRSHGASHPCWQNLGALDACDVNTRDEHHGDDPTVASSLPVDADNLRATIRECLELINARLPQSATITEVA